MAIDAGSGPEDVAVARAADDLVAACRAGDPEAFRALHAQVAPRVHAVAHAFFGGDEAAARDVVQQVFLKLLTRLDAFRGESKLTTWLHRLVVNECLDHRRARRRTVALEAVADRACPTEGQDEIAARRQRERLVRAAVASLPPKLRVAVLLKHYEGLSYDEMAAALGCAPGTVASRLSRGHALLGRKLESLGGTP